MDREAVGLHGTSISSAMQIKEEGFIIPDGDSGSGSFRGTGCYFWEHYDESNFAEKLAEEWWRYCHDKGKFSKQENPNCATIFAKLKFDNSKYIDFETKQVKGAFIKFLEQVNSTLGSEKNEFDDMCQKYDLFLDMLEEESGEQFDLVRASIPVTNGRMKKTARFQLLGNPIALVAKSTCCIEPFKFSYAA